MAARNFPHGSRESSSIPPVPGQRAPQRRGALAHVQAQRGDDNGSVFAEWVSPASGGKEAGNQPDDTATVPGRQKLQTIVMVTSAGALLVASVVFTLYDRSTSVRAKTQDLSATATMIGSNSTAALSFGDAKSAKEILAALRAKPNVINACIYDKDGRVLATYGRDVAHSDFSRPPAQAQAKAR